VSIICTDILNADISAANVIFTFLVPSCMINLSEKFLGLCSPGTLIISYKFPLPESDGWIPEKVVSCRDLINVKSDSNDSANIYAYMTT